MFYLYNKFTSASKRNHEEKKDNITHVGRNVTVPGDENATKRGSNGRDNKEEEDLFWALEEKEPSREGIMENERHENGVEKEGHIFSASEKMSSRCFTSGISKRVGDTWWDENPTWTEVVPLEGKVTTHLNQPNEHHENGSKIYQTNEKNIQQGNPPFEEFDENSDDFFKIDQENFSSFTFAASCANECKIEKEHLENSNDETKIKEHSNEQGKEDHLENGCLFDNISDDSVKINLSLHPRTQITGGHFDQAVMEGYPHTQEMVPFVESISHKNLTTYSNKGEECEEECPLGTIADIGVSCERGSRGESRHSMSCSRGVDEDAMGKGEKESIENEAEGDNPNGPEEDNTDEAKKDSKDEAKKDSKDEAIKDNTEELPMLDPVMPDDEESPWNFFQGVHFPQEWQNAAHESARSGNCSDAPNGESNYWPTDIHSYPPNKEDKFNFNFSSYESPRLGNINGKEEEDRDTCLDNKKLEKLSEELETQNGNCPIENASLINSEKEEILQRVESENGKEDRRKKLCYEEQTCEIGQSGVTEKWDQEEFMQINTFESRNIEMDNAKKSFDVFFCHEDEQYEVASISEKNKKETFFFENKENVKRVNLEKSNDGEDVSVGEEVLLAEEPMRSFEDDFSLFQNEESIRVVKVENEGDAYLLENKQTIDVVMDSVNTIDMMDLLDMVEGDGEANAKERSFFDRKETYQTEKAAEESKGETTHDVYSFETVDIKNINANGSVQCSTYMGLEELTGRNKEKEILYETGEDTEGIAVQNMEQTDEKKGGKGEQVNMEEMNESKGDSHFSGKEMDEIKTVELIGQNEKTFYPHQGEEESGNDHKVDEHSEFLEDEPDDDEKHMLGENFINNGEELNSILFPNISNEQFAQEKDSEKENKLESLLSVPTNMMQKKILSDEHEGQILLIPSGHTNSISSNDMEEENKWEQNIQGEFVEMIKEPQNCYQIWNEIYEKDAAQKVNSHVKMIKQNEPEARTGLTNEEIFEPDNLNDEREKKKKKKKIKKCRMMRGKPFEYASGSLKYLKALKELPPLEFLKCKDLRPFMRLFNIVLKTVRMFHFNEDYLYVLAGDETGCIYVKLEVKHDKFCQEEETLMLANCCVSVEGGHAFLEINEYSDIFSLKYNPIGTVNRSINFSDCKFVPLYAGKI
ncbi:conserved Plasmodium protein, unknown function [Plasmodium knowlesi strain H]|uniref:Uncharacterized protein n=3 Tax=Plasmodium knowlesi TaxID=5850 RepID=A0A5K1UYU8_PLAKH|nr:nucleic acid binding protein, putative [Plasmodium knowlesi strain H]OTN66649.1 Uncharacterized protein PKNOH_S08490600 [Plasmodium knowlesi]CAA9986823.1 nucleic acid binding protein, putative [Plasmodium knowlesi strain H]SBO23671.1 conserved Plasmodium protein, unknown function [Plasmodium knowlesi strain H]SBO25246.1 conserved Plasmodium protein, unknown function [Plasmodium knowlesi strain H]VVS76297.1 nucleic acid binding protein, putative [Plasmodium knowlesi strain H]|eukprot:XP_002258007.1 hypothetical protein, conserved in Plasmodium species [Plasmodium knowlesi strain H]